MAELEHPDHPIIDAPWTYHVVDFHYSCPCNAPEDHFLEMSLQKEKEIIRLRFLRAGNVKIQSGFPTQLGLYISDISKNGWEGIKVEVGDFENQSIHFYAKDVIKC